MSGPEKQRVKRTLSLLFFLPPEHFEKMALANPPPDPTIFGDTNLFIRARHPRLGAPYRAQGAPEGVDPHSTNYI